MEIMWFLYLYQLCVILQGLQFSPFVNFMRENPHMEGFAPQFEIGSKIPEFWDISDLGPPTPFKWGSSHKIKSPKLHRIHTKPLQVYLFLLITVYTEYMDGFLGLGNILAFSSLLLTSWWRYFHHLQGSRILTEKLLKVMKVPGYFLGLTTPNSQFFWFLTL